MVSCIYTCNSIIIVYGVYDKNRKSKERNRIVYDLKLA